MVVARYASGRGKSTLKRPPSKKNDCFITGKLIHTPKVACTLGDMLKVATSLREDFAVPHRAIFYNDMIGDEHTRYSLEPPLWTGSPRSSICIFDPSMLQQVESIPQLPVPTAVPVVQSKGVRFSTEEDEVHYANDSSVSATTSTWYNRSDYARFKTETKGMVIALYRSKGQLHKLDINAFTVTGLEKTLTHRQITGRKKICTMYIHMILEQQENSNTDNNPMQLRQISELYTTSSRQRAHIRAMIDHDLLVRTC